MSEGRITQTLVVGTVNPGTLTPDDIRRIRGDGTAIVRDLEDNTNQDPPGDRIEGDGITIDVLVSEGRTRPPPPAYGALTVDRAITVVDNALRADGMLTARRQRLLEDIRARMERL